eukprot:TRINITY_DN2761_c0_g1_i1.p1 TRINITY_DN2761_c0_g1~~TRINITY_DN2761_c0_g1_i1.p1  ORF type:complete len:233 (+),score=98.91 TRINITY_DN2761_c0_g1_i1:782-1480(+)
MIDNRKNVAYISFLLRMHRFFGKKKEEKPVEAPDFSGFADNVNQRMEGYQNQLRDCDEKIRNYTSKKAKGKATAYDRSIAVQALRQKKMIEKQMGTVGRQQMTMNNMAFSVENVKNTMETVKVMKQVNQQFQSFAKQYNVDDVADIYDDLQDSMADANELNEMMAESFEYDVGIDDATLDAELEELENMGFEDEMIDTVVATGQNVTPVETNVSVNSSETKAQSMLDDLDLN